MNEPHPLVHLTSHGNGNTACGQQQQLGQRGCAPLPVSTRRPENSRVQQQEQSAEAA
jgi:hypothetical protein